MVAGAGSGKTTSLVKCSTISANAKWRRTSATQSAGGLHHLYSKIAVGEIWSDVGNIPLFHVSTIHSFLWTLCAKPFQKDIGIWVRQRASAKLAELREASKQFSPKVQQRTRDKNARDTAQLEAQLGVIAKVRHFKYENGSNYAEGILGHDDIINMVPQLIMDKPLLASIVAQKYPFFFVDESQDTFPQVVDALKSVARSMPGKFCLGFFGDAMQKIYVSGIGDIPWDEGWKSIKKPENFRCPTNVLSVINNIRAFGDGLQQTLGRQIMVNGEWQPVPGTAKLFILPADEHRFDNLARVRKFLAAATADPLWTEDSKEADVRILVIVHRMAAAHLGFPDLYAAFNDGAPASLRDGLMEGTSWPLKPFLDVLLPLALAWKQNRQFQVMSLLRKHCLQLDEKTVKDSDNFIELLGSLKKNVIKLAELLSAEGNSTSLEVLRFADRAQLMAIDERLKSYMYQSSIGAPLDAVTAGWATAKEDGSDASKVEQMAIAAYLACPGKAGVAL